MPVLEKNPTTPSFEKLTPEHLNALAAIVGPSYLYTDEHDRDAYSHDWTEDLRFPPEVVVKPDSTEQVSQVLAYCYTHNLPVTPMGARTGLSGGCLPVYGGVALALERMNKILNLDERNQQMRVQAGCVTQEVMNAAQEIGLMYPPDPSSKESCLIGGNLAESAGGAHAVKYGLTRDYVLALEAVLPNGEVIRTGANVLKNSTGYNLTQLLVGSEGTLAVITEATLKLAPKVEQKVVMLCPFANAEDACAAVGAFFQAGVVPAALEFMEKEAIDFGQQFLGVSRYNTEGVDGHLLIELDGNDPDQLFKEAEKVHEVLEQYNAGEVQFADSAEQQAELWRIRRCLGEAVKGGNTIYKEEDTVVPRAELPKLLNFIRNLKKQYGFQAVCYGHAGDGNLHVNILKADLDDETWNQQIPLAVEELFHYVKSLNGTLSGEHGIGWVQRRFMPIVFSDTELKLMRGIKQVFDPKGMLNPGKIFPESLN